MRIKIDPLDTLCSQYVRMRAIKLVGGCERCLCQKCDIVKDNGDVYPAWKRLQASHFISRSNRAVRYDPDNLVGLCFGCHQYLGSHPLEHVEFFKSRLGDKFDLLLARSRMSSKDIDKAALELYLKDKIKDLEE